MVVNKIAGRIALFVMVGVFVLFVGSQAQAVDQVFETEGNIEGSLLLGFDPTVNLIPAATNLVAGVGAPCFTCPNTSSDAGGTTAGALTDSMFGIIRDNSEANVGQEGRNPFFQGQLGIPTGANTASAFTVQIDTLDMDFLNAGTSVPSFQPINGLDGNPIVAVGEAGMRMNFSTTFSFDPGVGTTATTIVDQGTFTGGQGNNNVQLVRFVDTFVTTAIDTGLLDAIGINASIDWEQDILEGGFQLIGNQGSFLYNGDPVFPLSSAPTGPDQTKGLVPTCIGDANPPGTTAGAC